jgi:hypothetical protein
MTELSAVDGLEKKAPQWGRGMACIIIYCRVDPHQGSQIWQFDGDGKARIRQGRAATLTSGVQQVPGRPPHSMREWAARTKTASGTA